GRGTTCTTCPWAGRCSCSTCTSTPTTSTTALRPRSTLRRSWRTLTGTGSTATSRARSARVSRRVGRERREVGDAPEHPREPHRHGLAHSSVHRPRGRLPLRRAGACRGGPAPRGGNGLRCAGGHLPPHRRRRALLVRGLG